MKKSIQLRMTSATNLAPLLLEAEDGDDELRLLTLEGPIARISRSTLRAWLDEIELPTRCELIFAFPIRNARSVTVGLREYRCDLVAGHSADHGAWRTEGR